MEISTKKGVSPLIATVLLIAFAVTLGAVVMNWGRAQLEPQSQNNICSNIEISLERLGERPNICYTSGNENKVTFLLKNDGSLSVNKLRITLISSQPIDPHNQLSSQKLDPGETKRIEVGFPSTFTQIQKVRITPIHVADLNNPLSEQVCTDKSIEVLQILPC